MLQKSLNNFLKTYPYRLKWVAICRQVWFDEGKTYFDWLYAAPVRKIIEFWGTKSSILGILLEILPFLPAGVSHNRNIQSKYALTSSNQTYILTNTYIRGYLRVFGMQLSSFWSTSPKIYDSWPQLNESSLRLFGPALIKEVIN